MKKVEIIINIAGKYVGLAISFVFTLKTGLTSLLLPIYHKTLRKKFTFLGSHLSLFLNLSYSFLSQHFLTMYKVRNIKTKIFLFS